MSTLPRKTILLETYETINYRITCFPLLSLTIGSSVFFLVDFFSAMNVEKQEFALFLKIMQK